jgi:signal transduction histidine kinase
VVDAAKLRQVVMNLVLNALQAMPGGGSLGVSVRSDGERAVIEVSDTGRGIPDSVRARLFEPFVSSREGGTGLGLAISKQIVEEHAGSIGFESSPGRTVFRVELPLGGPER